MVFIFRFYVMLCYVIYFVIMNFLQKFLFSIYCSFYYYYLLLLLLILLFN